MCALPRLDHENSTKLALTRFCAPANPSWYLHVPLLCSSSCGQPEHLTSLQPVTGSLAGSLHASSSR